MKRHSLWQRAATKYRSISIWQSDFMMHVQLQIEKTPVKKKERRRRWWWRKINKTTYDRIPTFEHDKTHPFDCTMATTTIVSPLLACIFFFCCCCYLFLSPSLMMFLFFHFGLSFAYLIQLNGIKRVDCRSWIVCVSRKHFYDVDVARRFWIEGLKFSHGKKRGESKRICISGHRDVHHTYAYVHASHRLNRPVKHYLLFLPRFSPLASFPNWNFCSTLLHETKTRLAATENSLWLQCSTNAQEKFIY